MPIQPSRAMSLPYLTLRFTRYPCSSGWFPPNYWSCYSLNRLKKTPERFQIAREPSFLGHGWVRLDMQKRGFERFSAKYLIIYRPKTAPESVFISQNSSKYLLHLTHTFAQLIGCQRFPKSPIPCPPARRSLLPAQKAAQTQYKGTFCRKFRI